MELILCAVNETQNLWLDKQFIDLREKPTIITLLYGHTIKMTSNDIVISIEQCNSQSSLEKQLLGVDENQHTDPQVNNKGLQNTEA